MPNDDNKKKRVAAILVRMGGGKSSDDTEDKPDDSEGTDYKTFAKEMIDAQKSGDVDGLADTLKNYAELCKGM